MASSKTAPQGEPEARGERERTVAIGDLCHDVGRAVIRGLGEPSGFSRVVAHHLFESDGGHRFRVNVYRDDRNSGELMGYVAQAMVESFYVHAGVVAGVIEITRSQPVIARKY